MDQGESQFGVVMQQGTMAQPVQQRRAIRLHGGESDCTVDCAAAAPDTLS